MDEIAVLQATFAQQTVDYEHAVHDTRLASASIGPKPANSQALISWKEKLAKEEKSVRVEHTHSRN